MQTVMGSIGKVVLKDGSERLFQKTVPKYFSERFFHMIVSKDCSQRLFQKNCSERLL